MLPFVLQRIGLDPATSSAPFVATLVDVTGLRYLLQRGYPHSARHFAKTECDLAAHFCVSPRLFLRDETLSTVELLFEAGP